MPRQPEPPSPADRVRASEARKLAKGGRRMPGGVLGPMASDCLEALQNAGYAVSATACITRALAEAAGVKEPEAKFKRLKSKVRRD